MGSESGFRIVEHTADVIVEAWGETIPACLEELAQGFCSLFAGPSTGVGRREFRVDAPLDELAPVLLEEIIYLLDTSGSIPLGVEISELSAGGAAGWITLGSEEDTEIVGPAPKAIARTQADLVRRDTGWTCRVTVDV